MQLKSCVDDRFITTGSTYYNANPDGLTEAAIPMASPAIFINEYVLRLIKILKATFT